MALGRRKWAALFKILNSSSSVSSFAEIDNEPFPRLRHALFSIHRMSPSNFESPPCPKFIQLTRINIRKHTHILRVNQIATS